jgi:hypothetical protein
MKEEHENEAQTLNNLYESLAQKYESVKHFESIESNLKDELERYKNGLDNEKKQRINEVNEKEREKI